MLKNIKDGFSKFMNKEDPDEEYVEIDTSSGSISNKVAVKLFTLKKYEEVNNILNAIREGYTIAVVDISSNMIKENSVAVSQEVLNILDTKEGHLVNIDPAIRPESIKIIRKKLDNETLSKEEIDILVKDIVNNALTEAEIAYFVSAVYKCGMNMQEIINLTSSIFKTGKRLHIHGKVVDKHSIGGIPGNRTTPIVVSICTSAGLIMPKTSSRAITTSAGTADTMETICKVDFTIPEIEKILGYVNRMGVCVIKHPGRGEKESEFEQYIEGGNFLDKKDLFRIHIMPGKGVTDEKNIEAVKALIAQD